MDDSLSAEFKTISTLIKNGESLVLSGDTKYENHIIVPNELATIIFTSGTTSMSKAVMLSNYNIASNIYNMDMCEKILSTDVNMAFLPFHHTFGSTGLLLFLSHGATNVFCDGLRHIQENLKEYHVTVFVCVPLLLEAMYKKINIQIEKQKKTRIIKFAKIISNFLLKFKIDIRRKIFKQILDNLGGELRFVISGASAIDKKVAKGFNDFGILTIQGYGLTECSPLVAGNTDFFQKDDSAGLPIPNVEYKIDSPNEEGVGEIIVKGPNVMLGYYEDEEKTKQTIIDGWFHTGDLGKIDENGYLYITGRCKSVIVTKNGKNIYPEEVEYYLNDSPLISESLVLGIQKENDDETYINAQIYPNIQAITEYLKGSVPTKEEVWKVVSDVVAGVNKKLPNYKHIKGFDIRENEFEKTTTQKIKRYGKNMKIDKNDK